MAEYGVTQTGFNRMPYAEIKKSIDEKALNLFGPEVDLSVYSPIGLFSELLGWQAHLLWQELEKAYYANWLDSAEGVNLDKVVEWGGLTRKGAQHAIIHEMLFFGDTGVEIPAGFKVQTATGVVFETTVPSIIKEKTIGSLKGEALIVCRSTESGESAAVGIGKVNQLVQPLTGIDSVINNTASVGARGTESDIELRKRYHNQLSISLGSSVGSLKSALMKIENVIDASVYENNELIYKNGRPAKSIECVVFGGSEQDIAQTILNVKPAGIETYGNKNVVAFDDEGQKYQIYFNRPKVRDVHAIIDIWPNDLFNSELSALEIRTNVIKYIGGVDSRDNHGLVADTEYTGLEMGESVYPWRIASVNKDIEGIENIEVKIGFDDTITTQLQRTSGCQDIALISQTGATFLITDQIGLKAGFTGTFYLLVSVDGAPEQSIPVALTATTTWQQLITAINTGLHGAAASFETVGAENFLRITSAAKGESSTILCADANIDGLLRTISDNAVNLDYQILDPEPGLDEMDSNKLTLGYRDIARTVNTNIKIYLKDAAGGMDVELP